MGPSSCSFYERRVFPWLNDRFANGPALLRVRAEALTAARGRVVEVGFGTGLNLPQYPSGVESIAAIEPNPGMLDRATPRIRLSPIPVTVIVGRGECLPLREGRFDTAVSTLTLCTVPDPALTLRELHRVLRDDGRLILVEHGLSEDAGVAAWQNRLNGLQNVLACGCHLNRAIVDLVEGSGFRFDVLRQFYADGVPRTHGWITAGTAVKA